MSIAKYALRTQIPQRGRGGSIGEPPARTVFRMLLGVAYAALFLLRHPRATGIGLIVIAAHMAAGWLGVLVLAGVVAVGLLGWWATSPETYRTHVWMPLRSGPRLWWCYQRSWNPVMHAHGLVVHRGQFESMVPRLQWGSGCGAWNDELRVDLVPGLAPEDFDRQADSLAHAFGARTCRITTLGPGRLRLRFATRDPLAPAILPLPVSHTPDLRAVPVGITEDGSPWTLPVLGTHVLVAGATGAGKGSVLWSLVKGMAADVAAGRVTLWGLDPKGGMELAFGQPMFARLEDSNTEAMVQLLEDAAATLDARSARLRGQCRALEPSTVEPLLVLVIDELASLTAYIRDRDQKRRIDTALQSILTKGRAAGVSVIGALQDPRKEVISYRDLFPHRVALRLTEAEQVDLALGDGAHERGAHCESIPGSLPGVGYVRMEGVREPVRVRAAYVSDSELRQLGRDYPAASGESSARTDAGNNVVVIPRPRPEPAAVADVFSTAH